MYICINNYFINHIKNIEARKYCRAKVRKCKGYLPCSIPMLISYSFLRVTKRGQQEVKIGGWGCPILPKIVLLKKKRSLTFKKKIKSIYIKTPFSQRGMQFERR